MTPMQLKLYKEALQMSTLGGANEQKYSFAKNVLMQLRKVCNHPYLFPGVEEEGSD